MPRDIISINSTHYIGNNLFRLKLPKAVEFKKEINYHYIHLVCITVSIVYHKHNMETQI